ncbi:MAG: sigma-70 family RNA polymerase sigma factor [Eubacteriales bacterium]|nr:sigma-70 family RNA polymerase sigma factor [Eubacteriales bacterium]
MDKAEFTRRASGCAKQLYKISWCILRSNADCEDAVQEALLRAWAKLHTLRNADHFETWLTRILINECRGMLRRRQRTGTTELTENIAAPDAAEGDVFAAIQRMDRRYAMPLLLRHMSGYTVGEIGKILRIPETTVKWRLKEGRRRLRALLAAEG